MANNAKKKQIILKERQDAEGIARSKGKGKEIPVNVFLIIKSVLVVLIPISYFLFSKILAVIMLAYVSLFFFARMAERRANKSVVKSNHIHIFKFDSALALVLILIAFVGAIGTVSSTPKAGMFENFDKQEVSEMMKGKDVDFADFKMDNQRSNFGTFLTNFGSLLTGSRGVSEPNGMGNFGFAEPPDDFVPNSEEMQEIMQEPPEGMGDMDGKRQFDMDDLPMNYMFSSILSTIDTVLIFSIMGMGIISILAVIIKQRKFAISNSAIIQETKIEFLDDKEIEKVLSFGEEVNYDNISDQDIDIEIAKRNNIEEDTTLSIDTVVADVDNIEILDKRPEDEI